MMENKIPEVQIGDIALARILHETFKKNMSHVMLHLAVIVVVTHLILWVGGNYDKDSTDAVDGPRSGMVLRTDHQTKCQYLETSGGGLTPRLNDMGEHLSLIHI